MSFKSQNSRNGKRGKFSYLSSYLLPLAIGISSLHDSQAFADDPFECTSGSNLAPIPNMPGYPIVPGKNGIPTITAPFADFYNSGGVRFGDKLMLMPNYQQQLKSGPPFKASAVYVSNMGIGGWLITCGAEAPIASSRQPGGGQITMSFYSENQLINNGGLPPPGMTVGQFLTRSRSVLGVNTPWQEGGYQPLMWPPILNQQIDPEDLSRGLRLRHGADVTVRIDPSTANAPRENNSPSTTPKTSTNPNTPAKDTIAICTSNTAVTSTRGSTGARSGGNRVGPPSNFKGFVSGPGTAGGLIVLDMAIRQGYFGSFARDATLQADQTRADNFDMMNQIIRDPNESWFSKLSAGMAIAGEAGIID